MFIKSRCKYLMHFCNYKWYKCDLYHIIDIYNKDSFLMETAHW